MFAIAASCDVMTANLLRTHMKHVFISHAGPDKEFARKLESDLTNAGHETCVDLCELGLGDDSIDFMNTGIRDARIIVILYSKHTEKARWQRLEINSSLWNQMEQQGGQCIVIRLDDTPLPPLLGPKVFAQLEKQEDYARVLESLCAAILSEPTASSIVSDAIRPDSPNPFRRVRAEYFEDFEPKLLGDAFAPPDHLKLELLEEMKPTLLEGSRGTGKTMLLLSLRARHLAVRQTQLTITRLFGFYLKLNRGAVCNAGSIPGPSDRDPSFLTPQIVQVTDIFCQEILVCFLESLLSELEYCIGQQLLSCDKYAEKRLVDKIHVRIFGVTDPNLTTIDDLKFVLSCVHRTIAEFIRKRFIYAEVVPVPIASLDDRCLVDVLSYIKQIIPELGKSIFVVLLDEYENLFPFQQKVINTFVKFGPPHFSIKIAKKVGTMETSATTSGQELQEINDFNRMPLIYDVEDSHQFARYKTLLQHITSRILKAEGYEPSDIDSLLPEYPTEEVDEERLRDEIAKLSKMDRPAFDALSQPLLQEKLTRFRMAAIYRVLYAKGKERDKRFAGLSELAFVSSGVIRFFQEILSVAFQLQSKSFAKRDSFSLLPEFQTKAVHLVSRFNLTTISRNVEEVGERLKYCVLDLGDCLRQKLLNHGSEPEAGRVTILDPELLETEFGELKNLLNVGIKEGVFQTKEGRPAFKPKHSADPQPVEFNISRIYTPVLQISPRFRWRTSLRCKDLSALIEPVKRSMTKRRLMERLRSSKSSVNQPNLIIGSTE
jgi:hypothetical protein